MIFWKYKLFLLTRLPKWRDVIRSYGGNDEGIEWLAYRVGAKYPILKPLGLCMVCTSFWIGLGASQSIINGLMTMVLFYTFSLIEKKLF
jgi:hypothetical protein